MTSTPVTSPEARPPVNQATSWAVGLGRTFRRVAIFQVDGTTARLAAVHGMGQPALGKSLSLLDQTPLRWAIAAASPLVGAGSAPGGSIIAATLGIATPRAYAVIPLVVGGRLIALAYLDQAGSALPLSSTAELFTFCDRVLAGGRPAPTARGGLRSSSSRPLSRTYRPLALLRNEPAAPAEPLTQDEAPPRPPIGFTRPRLVTPPPLPADAFDPEPVAAPPPPSPPVQPSTRPTPAPTVLETPPPPPPPRDAPTEPERAAVQPTAIADLVITADGLLTLPDPVCAPAPADAPRRRRWLARLSVAALLCAALGAAAGLYALSPVTGQRDGQHTLQIPPEAGVPAMAELLARERVIRDPRAFTLLARLTGADRELRAGVYLLSTGAWAWEVLDQLRRGQVHTRAVTVPEGLTLAEVAELLEREGLARATDVLREAHDPELLAELGLSGTTLEGFLFPETYTLAKGLTAREILRVMVQQFFAELGKLPGGAELRGEKLTELVTLASLVEREARDRSELAKVAGVFVNRLERNMRLESCATVQYLLGTPKARLTLADVRRESPYNTYLNPGLPPGPIANPGLGALAAAVAPERHDFLFFFAREDGSHQHEFSRTYAAHQEKQRQARRRGGG